MENPVGRQGISRRLWLLGSMAVGFVVALSARNGVSRVAASDVGDEAIAQPTNSDPGSFMDRAFDLKQKAREAGDQSYGAIIVKSGRIAGQAPSRVVVHEDPTAHAEMEAIRDAARRLGSRRLDGCVMYSSSPPCPMCEAAAYWAGVDRLLSGGDIIDRGRPRLQRC